MEKNGFPADCPAPGEDDYIRFWQQFCDRVEPYTYRFFYNFLGRNPHIVPEDIAYVYIESLLNPKEYRSYYSDKNTYEKYIAPKESLPKTYMSRTIGGCLYTRNGFHDFDIGEEEVADLIGQEVGEVVLKPSNNSHSGAGVMLFKRVRDCFIHKDIKLSGSYLQGYNSNFIVQEAIRQHPYLSQFCQSSCNTMQIMTYRSVLDESITVFGAVLRIGHEGSFVDNLFAGGGFVVIDIESGRLGNCIYDEFGHPSNSINMVDFSRDEFVLPFWKQAVDFAKNIAMQVAHHRLLAQDIIVDSNGKSRLIEFNVDGFNWGFTMYAGKIPFGDKFEEVIKYCLKYTILR